MSQDNQVNNYVNPRVNALKKKHQELSKKVEEAYQDFAYPDHDLNRLKKEKLRIKEELSAEEQLMARA